MKTSIARSAMAVSLWVLLAAAWAKPASAQISVNSANPNNAPQGSTNLIVKIGGNGFKRGASSKFFITGTTNPGGITVNSTAFVSATEVDANITVAADATVSGFDIEVTAGDRTGKGTDLFAVIQGNNQKFTNLSVTTYISDTDANGMAFMIQSDGQSGPKNGVVGEYDDGQQGISSILTANSFHNMPPGDWQFSALSSTTRSVRFTIGTNAVPFGAPGYTVTPNPTFTGTRSEPGHLEDVCTQIPNGSGSFNDMLLMAAGQVENCIGFLRYDPVNAKPTTFYRFEMTGNTGLAGPSDPETTQVIVTCNSVGTDGFCNDWFIDPQPATDINGNVIPGTGIARLNFLGNKGPVNLGDYYLTFHFHVTRP